MMRRVTQVLPVIFLLAACSRRLETGLSESDAQESVIVLRQHGIAATAEVEPGARKDGSSWQVTVEGSSDKVVEAWNVLRQNGLPRKKQQGLEEVFSNSSLIPTAGEERARLTVGLGGELAKTLDSINGVVDAHINVVLPDNNELLDKSQQNPTSASVLVRYQGNQPPVTETEIKSLVAKGVEGLTPENVSVVLKRVPDKALPPHTYGPLLANEWTVLAALTLACVSGIGSLALVFVSRRRKTYIRKLERELGEQNRPERIEDAQQALGA
jgi:type III secretion protein J